jgi:hypothetical protein
MTSFDMLWAFAARIAGAQPRVVIRVGQALFGGDGNFPRQLGEQLGALGVLLVLPRT